MQQPGIIAHLPVLCVGNLVAGGAGKTPTAMMIATLLKAGGYQPVFLTRGYGGRKRGPVLVDLNEHTALDVGDEAPLLARLTPTIVAADRRAGAELARLHGDVIVMDDGLQNPSLQKDFTLAVVDQRQGIGNGRVIPGGPLRAPLDVQIPLINASIVIGDEPQDDADLRRLTNKPVFHARLVPNNQQIGKLRGLRVLAFAGIGRPEKFFATLETTGAVLATTEAFPDHHQYSRDEITRILAAADRDNLTPITTAKDMVRLAVIAPDLASRIAVLDVRLDCSEAMTLMGRLVAAIEAKKATPP